MTKKEREKIISVWDDLRLVQILTEKMPLCLKPKLYSMCILATVACRAETQRLSMKTENHLNTNERRVEWAMLRTMFKRSRTAVWVW